MYQVFHKITIDFLKHFNLNISADLLLNDGIYLSLVHLICLFYLVSKILRNVLL